MRHDTGELVVHVVNSTIRRQKPDPGAKIAKRRKEGLIQKQQLSLFLLSLVLSLSLYLSLSLSLLLSLVLSLSL